LLPLIIKGYFGILNFHTEEVIRSYEKYFSFYYDKETETIHITIKHLTDQSEISIQEKILKHEDENDQHLEKAWNFYYNMLTGLYTNFIINVYDKYKIQLFSIYYMLYFVGFLFYLLILIGKY
jgi:hypothetical protein